MVLFFQYRIVLLGQRKVYDGSKDGEGDAGSGRVIPVSWVVPVIVWVGLGKPISGLALLERHGLVVS